jgi:hypothetical protein
LKSPSDALLFFAGDLEANMSSSESDSLRDFFLGEEAFGLALVATGLAALVAAGLATLAPAALGAGAFLGLAGPSVFAAFPRPLPLGLTSSSLAKIIVFIQ